MAALAGWLDSAECADGDQVRNVSSGRSRPSPKEAFIISNLRAPQLHLGPPPVAPDSLKHFLAAAEFHFPRGSSSSSSSTLCPSYPSTPPRLTSASRQLLSSPPPVPVPFVLPPPQPPFVSSSSSSRGPCVVWSPSQRLSYASFASLLRPFSAAAITPSLPHRRT